MVRSCSWAHGHGAAHMLGLRSSVIHGAPLHANAAVETQSTGPEGCKLRIAWRPSPSATPAEAENLLNPSSHVWPASSFSHKQMVTENREIYQSDRSTPSHVKALPVLPFRRPIALGDISNQGVESYAVTGSKQVEIGNKLSDDSQKYGVKSTCTSGDTLSEAATYFAKARSHMEKECGNSAESIWHKDYPTCISKDADGVAKAEKKSLASYASLASFSLVASPDESSANHADNYLFIRSLVLTYNLRWLF
ncbi:uncharacterized protein [Miscanthus floridulus]|uniref:uncharacterized protein isoform X2 n=1 Tax=Miscanthus floridulus TaxID=154761 RepID=UPI00345B1FC0